MPRLHVRRAPTLLRLVAAWAAATALALALPDAAAQAPSSFAAQIASLSEPGGYFDTDNLISNERSYLQVLPELARSQTRGGVYIGVGPDTNFSYIAAVRPELAFIVDIRRDNLLLHLLFKALFELSPTRVEYLAHLLGRPAPPAVDGWRSAGIDRLVAYFDRAALGPAAIKTLRSRVGEAIARSGVVLSSEDVETIARFHHRFVEAGLELRFHSLGRPPQYYYPTYRELLLETDAAGHHANYLASEESYQFVKGLQARHLVIPIVGDLAGPSALASIGRLAGSRGQRLTAFYTSNVEFYLFGRGTFQKFISNLKQIPRSNTGVIIRSVFGRYISTGRPGDGSSSHLHNIDDLIAGVAQGKFRSYGELAARGN